MKHARGRENRVEQRLGQKRQMLQPAGNLRHVPHSGIQPLSAPDRGGEKIDVVQEDIFGLSRADGQPVIDFGENRPDRVCDFQLVIAERSLATEERKCFE